MNSMGNDLLQFQVFAGAFAALRFKKFEFSNYRFSICQFGVGSFVGVRMCALKAFKPEGGFDLKVWPQPLLIITFG